MLIYTFSNSIKKNVRKEILNSIEKKKFRLNFVKFVCYRVGLFIPGLGMII